MSSNIVPDRSLAATVHEERGCEAGNGLERAILNMDQTDLFLYLSMNFLISWVLPHPPIPVTMTSFGLLLIVPSA